MTTMIQTAFHAIFHGRVPASGGLLIFAAAIAALALSACGGGGGSGGGPTVSGGGSGQTRVFGLKVQGVQADFLEGAGNTVNIVISKNNASWAFNPNHSLAAPSGWTAATKLNPAPVTHRFHVVTDITSFTDGDYLAYGHWSENFSRLTEFSGTEGPDFKPFFYGKQSYTGSVPADTATATYTGGAAGIYKTGTPGSWGYFKSNISLEANFGTGKITAMLSGFSALSAISPSFSFSDVTTSAATISGSSFTAADWGGRFFGPSGAAPTGAAGWFDGLTSAESGGSGSATLYGSFGANK